MNNVHVKFFRICHILFTIAFLNAAFIPGQRLPSTAIPPRTNIYRSSTVPNPGRILTSRLIFQTISHEFQMLTLHYINYLLYFDEVAKASPFTEMPAPP